MSQDRSSGEASESRLAESYDQRINVGSLLESNALPSGAMESRQRMLQTGGKETDAGVLAEVAGSRAMFGT